MIDIEIEKVDRIIKTIECSDSSETDRQEEVNVWKKFKIKYQQCRRVGLGILGYGDMIAMLGMKYGDDKCIKFTEKLFKHYHINLMRSQVQLAKDRDSFQIFDYDLEKDCTLYEDVPQTIIDDIKLYGRRNISFSTIAPTGSISMLAQVTSGIEPVFMRSYNRRRKLNTGEITEGIEPDHIDNDGIKWVTYEVFHHKLEQ